MLQQTGGDPSAVLEILSTIVKNKDWRNLSDGHGGCMTFLDYFRELGWCKEDLTTFVESMHHKYERPPKLRPEIRDEMETLRREIRDLANAPLKAAGAPVGSRNAAKPPEQDDADKTEEVEIKHCDTRFNSSEPKYGTSAYFIGRLKRDAPDDPVKAEVLEKVIHGQITPNAAAVQVGYRKPMISIPLDPGPAVRLIVKHFKDETLDALIRGLANWRGFGLIEPTDNTEMEPQS